MDQTVRTFIQLPLNGSTVEFDVPFEYLARKFVQVSLVSGDNRKMLVLPTDYRFVTKTRIRTSLAWGPSQGYDRIELRRFTSATERLVDFADGSILRANDLNIAQIQSTHIAEEARDSALLAMPQDDAGNLDARNRRIVRLAPGIDGTDAVNKDQLDKTLGDAGGILSDMKETEKDIMDYIQNFADDSTMVKGVSWVYNAGSAIGGEITFAITKPDPVFAVPYIEINGSRQLRGYHFEYDPVSKSITLAKPLKAGDFVVCQTAEATLPVIDLLAGPTGASQIGTTTGKTVQEMLDIQSFGVNVLEFMTFAERASVENYTGTNDNTEAFRKAFATGNKHIEVPPGKYHVKDLPIPNTTKLHGKIDYMIYNATSDAAFGAFGTTIHKAAGGATMFLWNPGCGAEGIMFDGVDRTASAIHSQSGGKISVMFKNCGFYRWARVGNRTGAYIGCSFQFCNFNQNYDGIYNTVDGNHIGCVINANKRDGVHLEAGADSNTFTNCRNEWNEGNNWSFFNCRSTQVVNEICDRAFGYGFRISGAQVTLINVDVRRSGRTATGAASSHFYIENSVVKMIGIKTGAGVDDAGGSIQTPSPAFVFNWVGPNQGRFEALSSGFTGFVTGRSAGSAVPPVQRITSCPGWDDLVTEGLYRKSNGRNFMSLGTANGVANAQPLVLSFSKPAVGTYSNDIHSVEVVWRNVTTGGSNASVISVVTMREGGNASMGIVQMPSRGNVLGEGNINDVEAPATQVFQVAAVATSPDGSTFDLTFLSKATNSQSFAMRGYLKA